MRFSEDTKRVIDNLCMEHTFMHFDALEADVFYSLKHCAQNPKTFEAFLIFWEEALRALANAGNKPKHDFEPQMIGKLLGLMSTCPDAEKFVVSERFYNYAYSIVGNAGMELIGLGKCLHYKKDGDPFAVEIKHPTKTFLLNDPEI